MKKIITINGIKIELSRNDLNKAMESTVRKAIKSVLYPEAVSGRLEIPAMHPIYGSILKIVDWQKV